MRSLVVCAAVALLAVGGAGLAWYYCDISVRGEKAEVSDEYRAMIDRLKADEIDVRNDLNHLMLSATCELGEGDRIRVGSLTRECLDAHGLLRIGKVDELVKQIAKAGGSPFHFLSDADRMKLYPITGESPSSETVVATRTALVKISKAFAVVRQAPDWSIKVEGEAPALQFLALLAEGSAFSPTSHHPELHPTPTVPAFSAAEAELLEQLDQYFNTKAAYEAFPVDRFPKMYVNDRISAIPTSITEYRGTIKKAIDAEKLVLLPGSNMDPEQVEAIDEIYRRLENLFDAIGEFRK